MEGVQLALPGFDESYPPQEIGKTALIPSPSAFGVPMSLDAVLKSGQGLAQYVDMVAKSLTAPPGVYNFGQLQTLPDPNAEGVIAWPGLPPETLRKMAATLLAPKIIIQSRVNDVLAYSQFSPHPWKKGWAIEMCDSRASPSEATLRRIRDAEQFILNCNSEYGSTEARKRDSMKYYNFAHFLALITRDSFTYDGIAVYTDMDHKNRVKGFTPLPAGNIRLAGTGGYRSDPEKYAVLVDEGGTIYRSFTRDELLWTVRNPRTDATVGGYGLSELDAAAKLVDGIENALELNIDVFSKNGIPQGMLKLKGLGWTNRELDLITRMWNNLKKGVCYSEDTEVLTRNGWKTFGEVDISRDEVATLKQDTKEFQWQKPTARVWQPYDGDMYEFKSGGLELLVTPNHRMVWAKTRKRRKTHGQLHINSAEELHRIANKSEGSAIGLPVTSHWAGVPVGSKHYAGNAYSNTEINMEGDDYCAFMGMYLSEGCITPDHRQIDISQFRASKGYMPFKHLLNSIRKRPIEGTEVGFRFSCPELAEHVSQFGARAFNKFIPDEIMNATPEQINIFLNYYFLGDGTVNKYNKSFGTSSKKMADQLQELLQKVGVSAAIYVTQPRENRKGGRIIHSGIQYRVTTHKQDFRGVSAKKTTYRGYIGCVEVPNGILLVRRKGQLVWGGNTKYWSLPAMVMPPECDIEFMDLNYTGKNEGQFQEYINMMMGIYCTVCNYPVNRLGFRISGRVNEPRQPGESAVEIFKEEDLGLTVFLQLLENTINNYLLWSRYPDLRFVFRAKSPKEDAREYEIRQMAQTYGERRAATDNKPLTSVISSEGNKKEMSLVADLMSLAPTDPGMAGIYQTIAGAVIKAKLGVPSGPGGVGEAGARIQPKKDPAESAAHGHASGIRRDSAKES